MALDKSILKAQIKQAFKDQQEKQTDPDAALDDLTAKIADAVDAFVKSATVTVTVNAGIPVTTAGTATAQSGATTQPGTGSAVIS